MTYTEWNTLNKFEDKAGFVLTPLQVQAVEKFSEWGRSLNRFETGSGKTVVATVVSLMGGAETTVVTVPPILLLPWQTWLNQVSERVLRYQGTPPERRAFKLADRRWILVSHAIFRKDFNRLFEELTGKEVDLIVDESQALKSPASILYKRVGRFVAGRKLQMLTGTPTSRPLDAYTYIKLTSPEIYRNYSHFESLYVSKRNFFGAVTEYQNLKMLSEDFAKKSLRYTKEEMFGYDNAPLYPDTSYDLSPEHMKLYKKLVEDQLLVFDDGSKIDATTATKLYHACQQAVCNYAHFSGDSTKRSAAYDLLDLTIETTDCLNPEKSKLIVWTYYRMTSRSVTKYLVDKGIHAVAAYSEVDSIKNFKTFMEDPSCRVGVFQPGSAGAGLNPQSVCSEALFLEFSTTPMMIKQAVARVDRMGQLKKPVIRFGIATGTIQATLLQQLLVNDDLVSEVEMTRKSLRNALLGYNGTEP